MRVEIPMQSLITDHDVWFLDSTIIRSYDFYINIRNYRLNLRSIQRELMKSKVNMVKVRKETMMDVVTKSFLEH